MPRVARRACTALLLAAALGACSKVVEPQPLPADLRDFGYEAIEVRLQSLMGHDLDAVMAAYAPDADIRDGKTGAVIAQGAPQIRAAYAKLLEDCGHLTLEVRQRVYSDDRAAVLELERTRCGGYPAVDHWMRYDLKDGRIQHEWRLGTVQ